MDESTKLILGGYIVDLAKGNNYALDKIYQLTSKVLFAVGNVYFDRKDDVEDIVQSFMLKLFKISKQFKENKNAYSWLIKAFKNTCKNSVKQRDVERKYIAKREEIEKNLIYPGDKFAENFVFIHEILDSLTSYERKLFIDRYLCNYSIAEIAKDLMKSKSTIEYQLDKLEIKIKKI